MDGLDTTLKKITVFLALLIIITAVITVITFSEWNDLRGKQDIFVPIAPPKETSDMSSGGDVTISNSVILYGCEFKNSSLSIGEQLKTYDNELSTSAAWHISTRGSDSEDYFGGYADTSSGLCRNISGTKSKLFFDTFSFETRGSAQIEVALAKEPLFIEYSVSPRTKYIGNAMLGIDIIDAGSLCSVAGIKHEQLKSNSTGQFTIWNPGRYHISIHGTDVTVQVTIRAGW